MAYKWGEKTVLIRRGGGGGGAAVMLRTVNGKSMTNVIPKYLSSIVKKNKKKSLPVRSSRHIKECCACVRWK